MLIYDFHLNMQLCVFLVANHSRRCFVIIQTTFTLCLKKSHLAQCMHACMNVKTPSKIRLSLEFSMYTYWCWCSVLGGFIILADFFSTSLGIGLFMGVPEYIMLIFNDDIMSRGGSRIFRKVGL